MLSPTIMMRSLFLKGKYSPGLTAEPAFSAAGSSGGRLRTNAASEQRPFLKDISVAP